MYCSFRECSLRDGGGAAANLIPHNSHESPYPCPIFTQHNIWHLFVLPNDASHFFAPPNDALKTPPFTQKVPKNTPKDETNLVLGTCPRPEIVAPSPRWIMPPSCK